MKVVLIILSLFFYLTIQAQSIEFKAIGGFNLSQLEGDNLSGFNKFGAHGGIGLFHSLDKNEIGLELLFNQKGSTSTVSNMSGNRSSITLNYVQLPIIYTINSWLAESSQHYKIGIDLGAYYARLANASQQNSGFENQLDNFKKNNIGVLVGLRYRFDRQWAISVRYDQSIMNVYDIPVQEESALLSYLVTLRMAYFL